MKRSFELSFIFALFVFLCMLAFRTWELNLHILGAVLVSVVLGLELFKIKSVLVLLLLFCVCQIVQLIPFAGDSSTCLCNGEYVRHLSLLVLCWIGLRKGLWPAAEQAASKD